MLECESHFPSPQTDVMMRPMETETSATEVETRESRREALKRFAQYAAVAPSAMVLLEPREGHAQGRREWGHAQARRGSGKGKPKVHYS